MAPADDSEFDGACHCKSVRFRVKLSGGLASARRCDCSFCRMRGAVAVTAKDGDLTILEGADHLTLYQFNTMTAKHYFCSVCGIYTHHRRRSNPNKFGINAACLDGVSPFDFDRIVVNDGQAHGSDTGVDRIAGVLSFEPRS